MVDHNNISMLISMQCFYIFYTKACKGTGNAGNNSRNWGKHMFMYYDVNIVTVAIT